MVDDNVRNYVRYNVTQYDGNEYGNGNVETTPAEGNGNGINGNTIRCYNYRGKGSLCQQLHSKAKEIGCCLSSATAMLMKKLRDVKVNCTSEDTLQQTSTSGTQSDNAPVYGLDGSTEIKRLQAQLGDQKGKSKDTSCVSDTLDPLSQKLENENVELEFQILNYAKENAHLKTTYKNLFDSISVTRAQTKTIIDSLQTKLNDTISENGSIL
uniref:Uncharacterized protein n=1 Tax=Tanacetum cinerariifolium TaxID=118510 RepID=A0A699JMV8_TANCI|nr:hypothetical protein [Tanacetum cinerariifolium]